MKPVLTVSCFQPPTPMLTEEDDDDFVRTTKNQPPRVLQGNCGTLSLKKPQKDASVRKKQPEATEYANEDSLSGDESVEVRT